MKTFPLDFLETFDSVFVGGGLKNSGKNLGNKLYHKNGIEIYGCYDQTGLQLTQAVVFSDSNYSFISGTNIKTWRPLDFKDTGLDLNRKKVEVTAPNPHKTLIVPTVAQAQIGGPTDVFHSAQVETPIDKVQGKPGRKPKFQGDGAQGE